MAQETSSLVDTVNRMKARWLKRIMYDAPVNSTAKCLAYAIADHLNCVTMDCWPSQTRLAQFLGKRSTKTLARAARDLERLDLVTLSRDRRNRVRYAPVFRPEDEDSPDRTGGNSCSAVSDTNGRESFLSNPSTLSSSKEESPKARDGRSARPKYERHKRGAAEIKIATLLGDNGMAILGRLGWHDDRIVDRLCRAYVEGTLGERELNAARLAGEQI